MLDEPKEMSTACEQRTFSFSSVTEAARQNNDNPWTFWRPLDIAVLSRSPSGKNPI